MGTGARGRIQPARFRSSATASLRHRGLRAPLRRPAGQPFPRLARPRVDRQHRPITRHALRVLGGQVGQHRGERRVVLQVVEDDLVVGVPVRVPGILAVVRVVGLEPPPGRAVAEKGDVVAAAGLLRAGEVEFDVLADLGRELRDPVGQVRARAEEALRLDVLDAPGPVVLVEERLEVLDDVRVVLREGPRAVEALFLATPECRASEAYKQAILNAGEDDIVLSERITGVPVAVIRTPYIERMGLEAGPLARRMLRGRRTKHWMRTVYALKSGWQLKRASLDESGEKDYWQAGRSVASISAIEPAGEVVRRFAVGAVDARALAARPVHPSRCR